ncbi:MAG TPA: alpha-glucuronidase family glycosyl hydrolase [Vicinamibacterales bacterium]|nr:alpha-glucuronidase family glycosyl hydrolase [Vicinamibacterales bacterium]
MPSTRREFLTTSAAAIGGICTMGRVPHGQAPPALPAEDGYRLWLRYAPLAGDARQYAGSIRQVLVEGGTPTAQVLRTELADALSSMLGTKLPVGRETVTDGTIVVGTPANSPAVRNLDWRQELAKAGPEGYIIRGARVEGRPVLVVASEGEIGALYGAFHLLRLIQTLQPLDRVNVVERPKLMLRLLNHWDNMDGSIERGYAGRSLWHWHELPRRIDPRYMDYARANASIGINGSVPNSVNADIRILTPEYLEKIAVVADAWRPYGVRMYLSANMASPLRLGKLATADPLDSGVAAWWKSTVDDIYRLVPDFGGFTVKANSEGQPGPKDYGRTHAQGANVLAEALAPHGGNVIWRAFIYDEDVDPDRAKRAYLEFTRLEGHFRPNVLVQVKNGAIDFQPREPFHPLFGALKQTQVIAEIQATQEYLGQARHLVYLGPMWQEFLEADTHAQGPGSTVARVLEGTVHPYRVTGMASVVNPGLDRNWCGHHFSQSNWYASGRLAWNPALPAAQIADEWTRMTFGNDVETVRIIHGMMMSSHESFVNYTMPLGLHHLIGGDHYAPMPQNAKAPRADWTATYYHQASADGIGFDRTMKGNQAVAQYFPPVRDLFDSLATCPEKFLLWFHRCGWDYRVQSGRTLWDELCVRYHEGAREAAALQTTWRSLAGRVDPQRHKEVADRLAVQVEHAALWRDQILKYFQQFSGRPIVDR